MGIYYHNEPIFGPRGPAGPDGNPIGTVISFMGTSAPDGYLVCDGSEYNITDYSDLAVFFSNQFGSSNYFGGDGEATFAVPDMRNLFLRGYHGDAEEKLSGGIGEKQEATVFPNFWKNSLNYWNAAGTNQDNPVSNKDSEEGSVGYTNYNPGGTDPSPSNKASFTSRPVNMAVLYCIKAM